jgi:hypothetical protein
MAIYCNTAAQLPIINQDYCNPSLLSDDIRHIAFTARGKGFGSLPTATEFNDRVSGNAPLPAVGAPNSEYPIRVKAATEYSEVEISLGRKVRKPVKTTIEFETEDVSTSLYEAHLDYQNNSFNPISAWYFTKELYFGGNGGVNAEIETDFVLSGDRKGYCKIKGKITWKGGDAIAVAIPSGLDFTDQEE